VTGIGGMTGAAEATDSYHRLETFLARVDAVTAADVQRVAAAYFTEANRTVGRFVPTRA